MLSVRIACDAAHVRTVQDLLAPLPTRTCTIHLPGASTEPAGDVFIADMQRSDVDTLMDQLVASGVAEAGSITVSTPDSWASERALEAELDDGHPDAVIWLQTLEDVYEQSKITTLFLLFMVLATFLAAIAVLTDSVVLVIGAMVLGPEFMAVIALGLGLVLRQYRLVTQSLRTLLVGFAVAIGVTIGFVYLLKIAGIASEADVIGPRPGTQFIFEPGPWSFIIAVIAAVAGVLALTSTMSTGIIGVFISVTTIPAAGNIAAATVFAEWDQVIGSAAQLGINIGGMAIAGWITLAIQRALTRQRSRVPA